MVKQVRSAVIGYESPTLVSGQNPDGTNFSLVATAGIADTVAAAGQATSPATGAVIASIAAPGPGVYRIEVTSYQAGTIDPASLADMELRHGAIVVGKVLSGTLMATHVFHRVTVAAAETITVNCTTAPVAAAVFVASVRATRIE